MAESNPLEHWAEAVDERDTIEAFLDWAVSQGFAEVRFVYSRSDILDRYFGIDRAALERTRRELLAASREVDRADD